MAGAAESSVDSANEAGAVVHVGKIEPASVQRNAAGAVWVLYDTEVESP